MSIKEKIIFPDPEWADKDGLLCYGGNLEPATLLEAYSKGIFPWYDKHNPILWWSPPIRMLIKPSEMKISKSLQKIIRDNIFEIKFDSCFDIVIKSCAVVKRKGQKGTWITPEMIDAYIKLHKMGYAHSVEAFYEGTLAGGLYGVSLGKAFFGESMFHKKSNASKVAFYYLLRLMQKLEFDFIDTQQSTTHLQSLGAYEIKRKDFLILLRKSLEHKTLKGNWGKI